jgi:hypothetical protein
MILAQRSTLKEKADCIFLALRCKEAVLRSFWKTFQKRSVSSSAPDTTVSPSGLMASCSTLEVCPRELVSKKRREEEKKSGEERGKGERRKEK